MAGQLTFHRTNQKRHHRIERRLHTLAIALFVLTGLVVCAHFIEFLRVDPHADGTSAEPHLQWQTALAAFLPVVGAALAAINNQGEFARLAKRNRAMAVNLEQISRDLDLLLAPGASPTSREVVAQALRVAQLMVDEVQDWRVMFVDRPPALPA